MSKSAVLKAAKKFKSPVLDRRKLTQEEFFRNVRNDERFLAAVAQAEASGSGAAAERSIVLGGFVTRFDLKMKR